tara:strand:+ start:24 stop:560 length:537 start_codon:yes stop_codon:yes gene_type:complete
MEDLTGEKKVTKVINLNTTSYWEKAYGKKQKYKDHENVYFRGEIKIAGKEDDIQECKECHKILPAIAFTSAHKRSDGASVLKKICRECCTVLAAERWAIKKNAPPKPDHCDNCHKNKKVELDHIHGTTKIRGWLCRNCNSGIGGLGDDLEGVLRGAIYLEKDESKIIEVLNGIKNEKK